MSDERNKYHFIYQDPTFPKEMSERFKRMDADTGPYMIAGHGPQSWRDKVRSFALNRFGPTGKHFAESMIGMSEEDKVQRYLDRTYGYANAPSDIDLTSRPASDLLKQGISDFGLVDAGLTALTLGTTALPRGVGTGAAILESTALGGDAYGEYIKGNTLGAGIMGALVGGPPLLRYFAGKTPPPKGQMEFQFENVPDLSRRRFAKALGYGAMGIGALAAVPGSVFRQTGKAAAKLLPVGANPVGNAMVSMLNVGTDSYDMVLRNMPMFGGKSSRQLLTEAGEDPKIIMSDLGKVAEDRHEFSNLGYFIDDIFHSAGRYDRVLTFDEFSKVVDQRAKESSSMPRNWENWEDVKQYPGIQVAENLVKTKPFKKSAYNEYLRTLKFLKEEPEGQDLVFKGEQQSLNRALVEKQFPEKNKFGFSEAPSDHPLSIAYQDTETDMYYKGKDAYEKIMGNKVPKMDFNDPIVGQKFSKNFPAINEDTFLRKFNPRKDLPNEDTFVNLYPSEEGIDSLYELAEKMIDK